MDRPAGRLLKQQAASHADVLETGRVAAAGIAADLLASDAIRRTYLGVG